MSDTPLAKELSVLDQILARKRAELIADKTLHPEAELLQRKQPKRRGFRRALEAKAPAIIAEVKRASPSEGQIRDSFDPMLIARQYEEAGAACLSVLTDKQFFGGTIDDLVSARAAVSLPVLRKDFTLEGYHLLQAAVHGADCVLLIVAALGDTQLADLLHQAAELGLDALVEVHDEGELDRAVAVGAELIGVNNRNLKTLEVSLDTSVKLAKRLPAGTLAVSESGIRTADDIARLRDVGYRGFLVGTSLMKQDEPGKALAKLLGRG
ncbi:MAG: indole-3-glycerol phosphate synthase TrpC [Acidobacteria bacterium]|nr:indole-3-glycerol phosphate synthase TrpC [Acidobacteriota bacterium]